jgi:hypothetical protein
MAGDARPSEVHNSKQLVFGGMDTAAAKGNAGSGYSCYQFCNRKRNGGCKTPDDHRLQCTPD